MKIEAGKYYRDGNGKKIGPMKYITNQYGEPQKYCWAVDDNKYFGPSYNDDGLYTTIIDSNYNLVAEYEEKTPEPEVDPTKTIIMEGCIYDRLLDNAIIQDNDKRRDHDGDRGSTSCKGMTAKDAMKTYGFVEGYYRLRKINTAPSMGSAPKVDLEKYEMEQLRTANAELLERCVKLEAYKGLFNNAIESVNEVFQGPDSILPDYCKVGDDKFEAVVDLAREYKILKEFQGHVNKRFSTTGIKGNVADRFDTLISERNRFLTECEELETKCEKKTAMVKFCQEQIRKVETERDVYKTYIEVLQSKKLEPPTLQNTRQIYIGEILEEGDFHYSLVYNNLFRQIVPSLIGQRAMHNGFRRTL